ncbi:DNA-binding transcriptional regulator, AcrR family [Prauserella marina]|uniref:DNA-binding transcriptional regulator, AcrR family n=2 Tax=Prauserella marina TaxID=530584 RepID=A0A1G6JRV0_9PSEU|nr:TetR family transcriptional regulator [Prauserella marina]SDC21381.1 DNA-binding transcriptional regulator, AcrR family [Prauserella marina]
MKAMTHDDSTDRTTPVATERGSGRRLGRAERREQIIDAATRAFAEAGGFAQAGLADVASAAGVTRMILYRHFDSKTELYRAAIDRAAERLHAAAVVDGEMDDESVARVFRWARSEPDAFRLLFRHAAREPEFRDDIDELKAAMIARVRPYLEETITGEPWQAWAAQFSTLVIIEAVMAWLDAGAPGGDDAIHRILRSVDSAIESIGSG